MRRYRWMQVDWPVSMRTLVARIQRHAFTSKESSGFILDRVRDDHFEARYIERYQFQETVEDPFGAELTFERVEFRQTSFRAAIEGPGLELVDPPRSSSSFLSQLLEATNFEMHASPLSVDVFQWASEFQEAFGSHALVDSIQLGSLQIDRGIKAKVVIKGDRDVREACQEITRGRNHIIEKIQCRVAHERFRASVLMANNASVKIEGCELHDDILQALRVSLPRS